MGIAEIKGEKEWLDKVREDSPRTNFTYCEASEPAEMSTPSFRLRRPESFVRSRTPHQSSLRSFGLPSISLIRSINLSGVMATREIVASGGPWNRLVGIIKGGLAFSESAGSLHIANGISEARSEDSTAPGDNNGLISEGLNRSSSSRSHS